MLGVLLCSSLGRKALRMHKTKRRASSFLAARCVPAWLRWAVLRVLRQPRQHAPSLLQPIRQHLAAAKAAQPTSNCCNIMIWNATVVCIVEFTRVRLAREVLFLEAWRKFEKFENTPSAGFSGDLPALSGRVRLSRGCCQGCGLRQACGGNGR